MYLSEILRPSCIKVPLESEDKTAVISELIDLLDSNGLLLDKNTVSEAIFTRERTRSTGIGSGIAIPHGKCDGLKELIMALGVTSKPIDFESVDGKPVRIVMLLASPANQTGQHIQALAQISRLMLDERFKQAVENASSSKEVYDLFSRKEEA